MTRLDALLQELARHSPVERDDIGVPQAAVALVLVPDPDRLLLIRRAEREDDPWSGHLALPGGRRAASDPDLMATAIRETFEETSIELTRDVCAAQLDDLVPTTRTLPPLIVRPFVFHADVAHPVTPSAEVSEASWLPLSELAAEGVFGQREIEVRGSRRVFDGYALPQGFLWGMTERIVTPVVRAWAHRP